MFEAELVWEREPILNVLMEELSTDELRAVCETSQGAFEDWDSDEDWAIRSFAVRGA